MKMKIGIIAIKRAIEKTNSRLALGYEATLDFNHGYLYALFQNKMISKKEYDALIKVYSNYEDGELEIDPEGSH